MTKLHEEQGDWGRPATLLEKLANDGASFEEYAIRS
jgi:hypothetical protein